MAANTYTVPIPRSAALANVHAEAMLHKAAPIAAGSARDLNHVAEAVRETEARKRAKLAKDDSVTAEEVALSVVRETAVAAEVASGLYGGVAGVAPAWATPLLALPALVTAIRTDVTALRADVTTLQADVATLRADVTGLRADVTGLRTDVTTNQANVTTLQADVTGLRTDVDAGNARLRVVEARRRNALQPDLPFVQLVKINTGVGGPLPGRPASNQNNDAVGTVYPQNLAPRDEAELMNMTHAQISRLAEWTNDDFGIVADDDLGTRCSKLFAHYTGRRR